MSNSDAGGGFAALREEAGRGGWKIILASLSGVSLGLSALPFYTLGVFAKPVAESFGWTRAVPQSGLIFSMIATVCVAGPAGLLLDRIGVRRMALLGQAGLAIALLLLATQNGNPLLWRANWFLLALLGIGTTPLTWARAISGHFVRARGTALGITLAGTGVTAIVAPPLIGALIAAQGWRAGYIALALAVVVIGMPVVWTMLRPADDAAPAADRERAHEGLTLGEAVRGYRFWLILAAFAGVSFGVGGVIPNLVPMLADQGHADAARYASLLGLFVIIGRLLAGYLLDRVWAPAVAVGLLALPALACLLLANQSAPALSAALIGIAGGAEFDLIAYLCSRYFGMRSFGRIYGWQWAGFSLSAGLGALSFGLIFDATKSYAPALYVAAALMLAGGIALLGLGRYPASATSRSSA